LDLEERGIEPLREDSRYVHGAKGVLKPGVFRGRVDPPRALELEDAAKALNPGRVDRIPLGQLPLDPVGHDDVVIDRVRNESCPWMSTMPDPACRRRLMVHGRTIRPVLRAPAHGQTSHSLPLPPEGL